MNSVSIILVLNVCTVSVIILSVHLLILRSTQSHAYLPLAWCLFCVGFIVARTTVEMFIPEIQLYWLIFSLPITLMMAPSLWLYVKGITNEFPWYFQRFDAKHFVLPALGLFIVVNAILLPEDVLFSVIADDGNGVNLLKQYPRIFSYWIDFLLISTFVLVLLFVFQSGYYCLKIFQRLKRYNQHLKDLFASTETKELRWMGVLLVIIGGVWLITAVNIIWDNLFNVYLVQDVWVDVIILIMIWTISIWGLRQNPGFEEVYEAFTTEPNNEIESNITVPKKYERSSLDKQQSQEIAKAIIDVMQNEQLYLDNELSLQKLSKHIDTPANYISQTLNTTIGLNFFDFVNNYRIELAKERLISSSMAVIDVAFDVGFNAKSSFYKAFKKSTSITPSEYRKQQRLNQTN